MSEENIEVTIEVPTPDEPVETPPVVVVTSPDSPPDHDYEIGVEIGQLRTDVDTLLSLPSELDSLRDRVQSLEDARIVDIVEAVPDPEPELDINLDEVIVEDDVPPAKTHWYNRPMSEWFGQS